MSYVDKYATAAELLADFRSRDIRVWMEQDQVAIDPKELLTKQDRAQISLWKVDIIGELWKEKRSDPALRDTCARVLERDLTARPGVLEALVWDRKQDEWTLGLDFDMEDDHVYDTDLEIRSTLSKAAQTLYEKTTGRIRVYEASWWHYNHGEPPSYVLSVEGLDLEAVVAEAKRLQDELDAFDIDDYMAD